MPYIGKEPARVPVTASDIPDNSITSAKILDGVITASDIGPNAVGNSEMADDAVGIVELSATGTASSTTFLRGDNTWAVAGITSFPFFKADESADNIAITNGQFPFYKANGSLDNIGVT